MEYFEQFEKAYKFGNQDLHFENDTMPRIVERFKCTDVSKIQQIATKIGSWENILLIFKTPNTETIHSNTHFRHCQNVDKSRRKVFTGGSAEILTTQLKKINNESNCSCIFKQVFHQTS